METKKREEGERGKIQTQILPLTKFFLAEDYHQKYYLRNDRALIREFRAYYEDERRFTDSTAVARANGILGGNGSLELLGRDLERMGLSEESVRRLRERIEANQGR